MNEPIMEFKTQEELDACLAEWAERLFLLDWILKGELHDKIIEGDMELAGQVDRITDNKTAIVKILRANPDPNHYVKFCAEETIVHELLHLRLDMCSHGKDASLEDIVYEWVHHQNIEQMAKSLIMAKYGIPFSWFKNF